MFNVDNMPDFPHSLVLNLTNNESVLVSYVHFEEKINTYKLLNPCLLVLEFLFFDPTLELRFGGKKRE